MSVSVIPGVSPRMLKSMMLSYLEHPTVNGRERMPLLIVGPPGGGKSQITDQCRTQLGLQLCKAAPIQHETPDYLGAMAVNYEDASGRYCPMKFKSHRTGEWVELLPTDPEWEGLVFLDEIANCPADMQKVVMGILDRAGPIGERISPKARFALAGNRAKDRAGSSRLLTPIERRCRRVELLFSMDDFQAWGASNGIHQVVLSYGEFVGNGTDGLPGFVPEFNPAEEIHATPATWAAVSDELHARPDADPSKDNAEIRTEVQSLVGPGHAAGFMAFRQHFHLLNNVVSKVFDAPASVTLDALETSAQHALIGAVASRVKERNGTLTPDQAENVGIFVGMLPTKTLQRIAVTQCDRAGSKQWKASKSRAAWIEQHADLLVSMNKFS